jgi:hypothetical protein
MLRRIIIYYFYKIFFYEKFMIGIAISCILLAIGLLVYLFTI